MSDRPFMFTVPERGTIAEVVVWTDYPAGRRVIKIDPPLRIEPGDTLMLPLTPAAVERTVVEETISCPKCDKLMILVDTGMLQMTSPARRVRQWWCGCGHTADAPSRVKKTRAAERRERWEAVQR